MASIFLEFLGVGLGILQSSGGPGTEKFETRVIVFLTLIYHVFTDVGN